MIYYSRTRLRSGRQITFQKFSGNITTEPDGYYGEAEVVLRPALSRYLAWLLSQWHPLYPEATLHGRPANSLPTASEGAPPE